MKTTSMHLSNGLSLVKTETSSKVEVKEVNIPTNHILVVDCSGSMSGELNAIRQQLKNKLPSLVKQGDTVSLIWFSGRGQYGRLADRVKVDSLSDLQTLNTAIDRWLKPVGMTGFVEPLRETLSIATSASGVYSLFFLTDGYDNAWSESEVVKATADLRDVLSGAVFVEYGWCCNRSLMAQMAESVGGNLVFCENFNSYEPVISSALSKTFKSSKKIEVKVDNPMHGIVFSVSDSGPCVYKVEKSKVLVPEDTDAVFYFSYNNGMERMESGNATGFYKSLVPVYQGISLLAQRMKSKDVSAILAAIGDVKLFNKFSNCYGKQNMTDFQTMVLEASKGKMFEEGRKDNLKIDPNAFTILDLLFLLSEDDDNLFIPSLMDYKRTSRATEDAIEDLTDDEKAEVEGMMASAKNVTEIKAVQERIASIVASKPKKLKFIYDDAKGYPISNLVWNETRPNVSVQVRCEGTVELPDNAPSCLPKSFKTFIWRNYTIIRDGIANIDTLPVHLSKKTFEVLRSMNVIGSWMSWDKGEVYMINLRNLPTINQSMVGDVSAKSLFSLEYELMKQKASQKVYNAFKEEWFGKRTSVGFKTTYGDDATAWLTEHGITDYSGFAQKQKQAASTDFYMGIELETSIKGLSSIPSVNDFKKKIGKSLTGREQLLKSAYDECMDAFAKYSKEDLKVWIETTSKDCTRKTREIIQKMAEIKFGIVVGQVWPKEFPTLNDNTLTLKFDGNEFECSMKMSDVKINI